MPIVPLSFEFSAVRKSKMLISTNSSAGGSSTQTFANPLRLATDPVTAGAAYRITNPAGLCRSNHRGPRHRRTELRPGGL